MTHIYEILNLAMFNVSLNQEYLITYLAKQMTPNTRTNRPIANASVNIIITIKPVANTDIWYQYLKFWRNCA